jgi:hypothetical protein
LLPYSDQEENHRAVRHQIRELLFGKMQSELETEVAQYLPEVLC